MLAGCALPPSKVAPNPRAFDFKQDTFSYANELVWEYHFDEQKRWVSQPRKPAPDYTHHCFVVARSARQFFEHARFAPQLPVADAATYARLIEQVVSLSAGRPLDERHRIIIPGFANLHEFSRAHEALLKQHCGGAWQSYFQRGHWRMVQPFTRHHQAQTAENLTQEIHHNHPPVVHVVRFPQLTINHALLLFDVRESGNQIRFSAYDPNRPDAPTELTFDRDSRTFQLPGNDYFPGGRVDVYEVYRGWLY